MQGKLIRQINNIKITQVTQSGFVAWSPSDEIVEVSRDFKQLADFCNTQQQYLVRGQIIRALIDVDSTLVDFHGAIKRFLAERGIKYYPERLLDYYGTGAVPEIIGCDWQYVRQTMLDPTMYNQKYLKLYPGVQEGLKKLRSFASTNCYTGAENVYAIYQKRLEFCQKYGLGTSNVIIGSKEVRAGFDVLFDDNPNIIQKWVNSCTPTLIFMIDQPYNRNIDLVGLGWSHRVMRCKSFAHGVDLCQKHFEKLKSKAQKVGAK